MNSKQIKSRIKSVSNIQKITSALEVVSTIKLQKLKEQANNFKYYMTEFLYILSMIDFNMLFQKTINKKNKKLIIVVGTDKGLCGSLNSKLFKIIYEKTYNNKNNYELFVIGKKALEFFSRLNYNIVGVMHLKDNLNEKSFKRLKTVLTKAIKYEEYDNIDIYFNYFKNSMVQIPSNLQIYPLNKDSFEKFIKIIGLDLQIKKDTYSDIIIEPSKKKYYEFIIKKLVTDISYGVVLQNKAGEHAARMIAMKNAKDNSISIEEILTISYNKQRQSSITQEISEIVSAKIAIE